MAKVQTSKHFAAPVQRVRVQNEFILPAGELGDVASGVDLGYAEREPESSAAGLWPIAEG